MPLSHSHDKPIAVTVGEPAGIGLDTYLVAFQNSIQGKSPSLPPCVLLCDPGLLVSRSKLLNCELELAEYTADMPLSDEEDSRKLYYQPLNNALHGTPGVPNPADADGIIESIASAVKHTISGSMRAVVTLPINKKSLYDAGFEYPGHTEFLGALSEQHWPELAPVKPVMMLAGPKLKAIPVTIHIPLQDVPAALTTQDIIETATIAANDLQSRFGIDKPRLAISGLNPHAGENGSLGNEDAAIVAPAVERLQLAGIDCVGPLPADTMFHTAARARYDVAICMYHDQALIPAKALGFDDSVNVTLGLPFVRTSPDHGTAFDIAGTGKANPASTAAAIHMADQMTRMPR